MKAAQNIVIFMFVIALFIPVCADQIATEISVEEAKLMIDTNQPVPGLYIIDVRTPEEFTNGHLSGSTNIDFYADDFQDRINLLNREPGYILYCRSGRRSRIAMNIMKDLEFSETYSLKGGITAWKEAAFQIAVKDLSQISGDISPAQAAELIGQGVLLIDVRTPSEFDQAYIKGAILIDYYSSDFSTQIDELNRNTPCIVYCRSGNRAGKAMNIMVNMGFMNVQNIAGGITRWISKGFPVVKQ